VPRSLRKDERIRETRVVVVSSKNQQRRSRSGACGRGGRVSAEAVHAGAARHDRRGSQMTTSPRQLRGGSGVCLHPGRRAVRDRRHPGARSGRLPGVDDGARWPLSHLVGVATCGGDVVPIADARGVLKRAAPAGRTQALDADRSRRRLRGRPGHRRGSQPRGVRWDHEPR